MTHRHNHTLISYAEHDTIQSQLNQYICECHAGGNFSDVSPFDKAYSTLTKTMRLSCIIPELQRVICQNSPTLTYPTCIWRPPLRVIPFEFCKDLRHQTTTFPGLSCGTVIFSWTKSKIRSKIIVISSVKVKLKVKLFQELKVN